MDATATRPDPSPHVAAWRRRGHPLEIGLRVAAGIVGIVILLWLVLFITKGRFLKPTFEKIVGGRTERMVQVAGDFQLYLNPINVKFLAEGMTISNPDWASRDNFFEARLIDADIATVPLIFGNQRVNWLQLVGANVDFEWDESGKRNTWTMGDPNRPAQPLDLPLIRRAQLEGTSIRYLSPQMRFVADLDFETVRATNDRFDSEIRFSGGGSSHDRQFTVAGALLSPNQTIGGGRNQLVLRAEGGGNRLDMNGTLAGATELEGAQLRLRARGRNLATLVQFLGAVTPPTRTYDLTSNLTKRGEQWRFTGLRGTFGDSDIAGAMTMQAPEGRLRIDAQLASKVLDILDAGPWIGYDPERLERMGGDGAIVMEGGRPRVLPDASLDVGTLSQFDAKVDYQVATVRMDNFPVSNIALTLDLDRSLLKLSPLTFDVAGGHLASDININARGRPVRTDYDIRLSPTRMGVLLAKFGAEASGTSGLIKGRVQLSGTGDSVRNSLASANGRIAFIMPAGTFWTRNVQLAELDIGTFVQKMFEERLEEPVQINCGLIAFTVREGIAAADPILIDTRKNVIAGRGGFSFKTESIDLGIRADAKTFSLFSGQSPVGVGGHFAAPSINPISGELLARAGAGLGLGALVSPIAGILAFVDLGDADDTNCGPVLAGSRAAAQRDEDGDRVKNIGSGKTADPDAKDEPRRKKFLGIF